MGTFIAGLFFLELVYDYFHVFSLTNYTNLFFNYSI